MTLQPARTSGPPTPESQESAAGDQRNPPRSAADAVSFIQPLHAPGCSAIRVDLIDSNPKGVGIRAMIPLPAGAVVVLSIAHHAPMQGLFLSRVAHCTKLANGRYHIGMAILEQREGNLNATRIPDAWRQR